MNTIKLDIQVNNKNYNFVFNNINDSDVKLNIDLPAEEDSQIDRNEMRSRIRFLEERLRRSNRQAQNRQAQNRQAQNRQAQNRQTQQLGATSMHQQITEINMLLRLLQDINNATNAMNYTTTANTYTTNTATTANATTHTAANTYTTNTATNTATTANATTANATPSTATTAITPNTDTTANATTDTANTNLPLLIDVDVNQPTQLSENKNIIEEIKQEIPQNIDNTDNNILTNDLFNFADFLSELSTNPRRLYRDAGKINRAPIPIEECIINLQNYSTILREKPVQLNSYIEIAKAIDELIRNAMSCNDRLISRYGILMDLEYSKYMVKMCKKSSQSIFDKFLELTDFEIPGETSEQAATRQKIKLIACNLRDGKLNDILHVLDTPGCICQFCN